MSNFDRRYLHPSSLGGMIEAPGKSAEMTRALAAPFDQELALSPYKFDEWRKLSPLERLDRAWALRKHLRNPQSGHDSKLFQHLECYPVSWLLISGQATILYGAETFSEDIDIGVAPPTAENLARFRLALRDKSSSVVQVDATLDGRENQRAARVSFVLPNLEDVCARQATCRGVDGKCRPLDGSVGTAHADEAMKHPWPRMKLPLPAPRVTYCLPATHAGGRMNIHRAGSA